MNSKFGAIPFVSRRLLLSAAGALLTATMLAAPTPVLAEARDSVTIGVREGWRINIKRTYKLYNELGLQLRNKPPKRRVKAKLRDDRAEATRCNQTWAMDFVHDQLATGKKLRILTIVDTWSRFSPAVDPRYSYRGEDVVATLERVCREHGYP
jgi:transposase InsO family protein